MENRKQQILSEIKEMMSSIREQLEQLDTKMAELQYEVDPQSFTVDSIDLGLDYVVPSVSDDVVPPVSDDVEEIMEVDDDLPIIDIPDEESEFVSEPEPPLLQEPEDDLPCSVEQDVVQDENRSGQIVIDTMIATQTWRTDMPGAPVRDVRSAISLNDRVLFINVLFDEDPMAFQETLTAINQMSSLDDVYRYLLECRPSWDFESETVYRFMMAVRRKLN